MPKVRDKYIIEIKKEYIDEEGLTKVYRINNCNVYLRKEQLDKLTLYTEPNEQKIRDQAHEEAWEFAQCIANLSYEDITEAFDLSELDDVFLDNTYSEAKAKYDDWKKKTDEIRVGDEITSEMGSIAVVMHIDSWRDWQCFNRDGYFTLSDTNKEYWRKTGRSFPEVVELLEKMKEE